MKLNDFKFLNSELNNILSSNNSQCILVSLIALRGSAPQNLGAKMIVDESGLRYGTIGGGKIEARSIQYAQQLIKEDALNPDVRKWNLQKDIGMTCGGEVTMLFEPITNESRYTIAIFGAGHVSQALVPVLAPLNFNLKIIDRRQDWLDRFSPLIKNSNSSSIELINLDNEADYVSSLDSKTFIISMTMGHSFDVPILKEALLSNQNFPFIGVIGSESKKNAILKDLHSLNLPEDKTKKLICPIGEDFGDNSPAEIAISIAAQLLKLKDLLSKSNEG